MPSLLAVAITTAVSAQLGPVYKYYEGSPRDLLVQANFAAGSGGTSADAYVQTTVDGGLTWTDIANFHFTTTSARRLYNLSSLTPDTTIATPGDGALTANTAVDGLIGSQLRVKYTTVGTYVGATLDIDVTTARGTF